MDQNKTPVINASHKRSKLVKVLESIISIVLTIILWIFMINTLYTKLVVEATESTFAVLDIIILSFAVALVVLGLWQLYNWLLFHNKTRRKEFREYSIKELGEFYGINEEEMNIVQDERNIAVVEFKDNKYYYCVEGHDPIEIISLRKRH